MLEGVLPNRLTEVVFPPPAYSPAEETEKSRSLNQTWFAQPALGAAGYAMYALSEIRRDRAPDVVAGHSYGEYAALCGGGRALACGLDSCFRAARPRRTGDQGTGSVQMVAVQADADTLATMLAPGRGVHRGANAPDQTIMGGQSQAMEAFR